MRTFFLLLTCFAWQSVVAQGNSDKLVAYFPFKNCGAFDESGNNNAVAILGDTTCVCGAQGEALQFDSLESDGLFFGPMGNVFSTSDFTISFYIKPFTTSLGGSQVILSKRADCSAKQAFWVSYAPKSKVISSTIMENDSLIATVTAKLDADRCWQFITLVRNNTRYTLFINGVERASGNSAGRIDLTSNVPFKVAQKVCTLERGFIGAFDELRFHTKALDPKVDPGVLEKYFSRPDRILNRDTLIYLGNSFQIMTSESCAKTAQWQPTTGLSRSDTLRPLITPLASTVYTVDMNHSDGCVASDSIAVTVIDPATLDCNKIFIPNAFTPGGTIGPNNVFGISNPYSVQEFISFEVFDRWGGRLFAATTPFEAWDGAVQGQAVNPGVFLYRLRYKCEGQEKIKAGSVTLLR